MTALIVFGAVYLLIIVRNLGRVKLPVWVIMFAGAVAVIFLGVTPLKVAYQSVNLDVILFLIGMFSLVSAMEVSGLLEEVTVRILNTARSPERLLALLIVAMGLMAAFLMNDTIALVATPVIVGLARRTGLRPSVLLIPLAFSVTIGSAMTPIGNPQNLLVALESGIRAPFFEFLRFLALPTGLNFLATYYILRLYYRRDFRDARLSEHYDGGRITDPRLAKLASLCVVITIVGFFILTVVKVVGWETDLNFGTVALLGSVVLYLLSSRRREIIRGINWSVILFFIFMFILMQAVWDAGVIDLFVSLLPPLVHVDSSGTVLNIVGVSVLLSQFMSNVPFVVVYLRVMEGLGFGAQDVRAWIALAGGSTLAGNLTLLGAASTIIILEAAEERGCTFSFFEFLKVGSIVTVVNIVILSVCLMVF